MAKFHKPRVDTNQYLVLTIIFFIIAGVTLLFGCIPQFIAVMMPVNEGSVREFEVTVKSVELSDGSADIYMEEYDWYLFTEYQFVKGAPEKFASIKEGDKLFVRVYPSEEIKNKPDFPEGYTGKSFLIAMTVRTEDGYIYTTANHDYNNRIILTIISCSIWVGTVLFTVAGSISANFLRQSIKYRKLIKLSPPLEAPHPELIAGVKSETADDRAK